MTDCYCEYECWEIFRENMQAARKTHLCYECGGSIHAGEKYQYTFGVQYGDKHIYKTCADCLDILHWVQSRVECLCWHYGSMISDCEDELKELRHNAPAETAGLMFAFYRKIVLRDRARKSEGERDKPAPQRRPGNAQSI